MAGMASEGGGDRDGWSRVFVPPRGGRFFRWTVHKRLGVNWTSHRGAKEGRGASATVHSLGGSLSRWVTYAIRWRRLYRMVGWSSSSSSKPQRAAWVWYSELQHVSVHTVGVLRMRQLTQLVRFSVRLPSRAVVLQGNIG